MSRLPTPGQDNGTWGAVLNDYLSQSHNSDGTLKTNIIGTSHIQDNSITDNHITSISQSKITGLTSALSAKADTTSVVRKGELVFNVRDYGAVGDGVADDTTAIQSAITAGAGNKILIPAGTYNVTGLTISAAQTVLEIGAGATLVAQSATTDILVVSGANCSVLGPGIIRSPQQWDGTNVAWTYAVIRVSGHDFTCRDLSLVNIPKVGIGLQNVNSAIISNCRLYGNYPSNQWHDVETGHFGIAFDGGPTTPNGMISITNNIIRTCVQGVFVGTYGSGVARGVVIDGNAFEGCWNHGIYHADTSGNGMTVNGNSFLHCQLPVAITGKHHVVNGNTMITEGSGTANDITGISVRDAEGCIITNNTINGETATGGAVIACDSLHTTSVTDNIIANNTVSITGTGLSVVIRVGGGNVTAVTRNLVSGNAIKGMGPDVATATGVITVLGPSGGYGYYNRVVNNNISLGSVSWGIAMLSQWCGTVNGNNISLDCDAPSSTAINFLYGYDTRFSAFNNNRLTVPEEFGANITVRGYRELGTSNYNQINYNYFDFTRGLKLSGRVSTFSLAAQTTTIGNRDTYLDTAFNTSGSVNITAVGSGLNVKEGTNARMGTATLVAGAATVATTAVTASSRILLTSQVDGGTPGFLRISTRTAGVSFTISSSSNTDTSTVAWLIVEPAS